LLVFEDVSRIRTCDGALEAVAVDEEFLPFKVVMYDGVEVRLPSSTCSTAARLSDDTTVRELELRVVVVAKAFS
jgi:hypothetical protein